MFSPRKQCRISSIQLECLQMYQSDQATIKGRSKKIAGQMVIRPHWNIAINAQTKRL